MGMIEDAILKLDAKLSSSNLYAEGSDPFAQTLLPNGVECAAYQTDKP